MKLAGDRRVAESINTLARFCGKRDIASLTRDAVAEACHAPQADVMALFGGSILCGGDVLAEAMQHEVAAAYVIVGGAGHTTEALRETMRREFPRAEIDGLPEAGIFAGYLKRRFGLEPDLLECESTNCGNNITYLLDLIREKGLPLRHIILAQDATMQRRMEAGFLRHMPLGVTVVNYATYTVKVVAREGNLAYEEEIPGMWGMERYVSLLMGEIPRLMDDGQGYGPKGRGYIAHVDIPDEVLAAYGFLKQALGDLSRAADAKYASRS